MGGVSGVHHVAIGVKDLERMKSFYRNVVGFSDIFAEFAESEQPVMREVTRSSRAVFAGVILAQKGGGVLLELIHMSEPLPRPVRADFRYGDIGVAKVTVAVTDVNRTYEALKDGAVFCTPPKSAVVPGWGDYVFFYCRDPEGNLVELVSAGVGAEGISGVCRSVGLSVSNLERSLAFYRDRLGFTTVFIDIHEGFSGLVDEVSGSAGTCVRSCLLSANKDRACMIELFEVVTPRGRSIPFSTRWGDFGYLQTAFSCDDIRATAAGMELLCNPKVMEGGIPDHPGEFVYVRDPDGIPVEFLFLPG
jgi:catechol 2,3-dioxygenase-like lactoylglutathione lyase family enzyme